MVPQRRRECRIPELGLSPQRIAADVVEKALLAEALTRPLAAGIVEAALHAKSLTRPLAAGVVEAALLAEALTSPKNYF